ncbi:hypothetical protein HAX54_001652 [Datura stramonium]|uniref:Uncharacterized protein n=1 Tax=Datura stramonium TaxID=4076 RepID=A0ABS8T3I3_DATST|nr:hypothetical protein [Datura stramonium]
MGSGEDVTSQALDLRDGAVSPSPIVFNRQLPTSESIHGVNCLNTWQNSIGFGYCCLEGKLAPVAGSVLYIVSPEGTLQYRHHHPWHGGNEGCRAVEAVSGVLGDEPRSAMPSTHTVAVLAGGVPVEIGRGREIVDQITGRSKTVKPSPCLVGLMGLKSVRPKCTLI